MSYSLQDEIKEARQNLLQAVTGLAVLTDVMQKIDVDSDCAEVPFGPSLAPRWWSPFYQKSLIAAAASLAQHVSYTQERLEELLMKQERGEQ